MISELLIVLILSFDVNCLLLSEDEYIYPGLVLNDTNGKSTQAHSAGILIDLFDNSYWWYGESLKTPTLSDHRVNLYHSKDLLNWVNMGQALHQNQIILKDHPGPHVIERPKVVWNEKTKLCVMWFHLDSANHTYRLVGVATSPTPNHTFTFIDGFQPDGYPSLDLTIYQDIRGVYFVRTVAHEFVGISKLTDDYLNTTGITSRIDQSREGQAILFF